MSNSNAPSAHICGNGCFLRRGTAALVDLGTAAALVLLKSTLTSHRAASLAPPEALDTLWSFRIAAYWPNRAVRQLQLSSATATHEILAAHGGRRSASAAAMPCGGMHHVSRARCTALGRLFQHRASFEASFVHGRVPAYLGWMGCSRESSTIRHDMPRYVTISHDPP